MAIEAGISLDKFWDLTWRELMLYIKAYENKELKLLILVRRLSYQIYMSYPKKKDEPIEKYWPHPWDKKPDRGEEVKPDEVARRIKLFKGF